MRRLVSLWPRDRRQAQAGATLVELLVSLVIMGLALTLIVGTFSTGLLQASLAKRNTAAVGVLQYELDQIGSGGASTAPYSDCFATEDPSQTSPPVQAASFQGACPSSSYTLRVDLTTTPGPSNTQVWSIAVISTATDVQVGGTVQVVRGNW
jgi:type II secretory pathway pseudopilin PulG